LIRSTIGTVVLHDAKCGYWSSTSIDAPSDPHVFPSQSESTEVGIVTDVPQSLTASDGDAAADDEPTLELISVELALDGHEGILADPIFNEFECDLGVGFTQSSGCALMYALKFGSLPHSGNFRGNHLSVMHKKIIATL
jgi:hypothetical protein